MFIFWIGFATSLSAAEHWVTNGLVSINSKIIKNPWSLLDLYDFVEFNPLLWPIIWNNLVKLFFYASKASRWYRCVPTKLWSLKQIARAHFILSPGYLYTDFWTFNLYWWKESLPSEIKYYFSVNISNIMKYVTI